MFGNGGNDSIYDIANGSNDTFVGGFGHDSILDAGSVNLIFGNQDNDTILAASGGTAGTSTVFGGLGDESIVVQQTAQAFGNEGSDTIYASEAESATVIGGNDSADGNDLITTGLGADFVFGNGGADTIVTDEGSDTVVGGAGSDTVDLGRGGNLAFGNEGDDTIASSATSQNTVFAGAGDDSIRMTNASKTARDTLQGNEGNDSIRGNRGVDTISGGSGSDVFAYSTGGDDGNNAAGGGPVEHVTDVSFAEDKFQPDFPVVFAASVGAGTGANAAANSASAAAFALNASANENVAAQFTFNGRTFLVINQDAIFNAFDDTDDLLLEITGVTGTIATSNFI
jgi:Ca2+-binding RTX toxin-like protein